MRFWTVQPLVVWEQMEGGDAVRVDPDHPKYGGERPWQYDWLAAALQRNRPGFVGGWPWWLLCEEPDLAQQRAAKLPGGRDQVSIELELPEDRFAAFPLWMWETIHTGHYLALTGEEFAGWDRELRGAVADPDVRPLPEPWQSSLEESWERLFQPDPPRFWYRDGTPPDDPVLAGLMREASEDFVGLTEELRAGDTVDVVRFTAAG